MADLRFFDTNVLVYAHDASDKRKYGIASALVADGFALRSGALSTQVVQEFYVVSTRRWRPALPRDEARALVSAYAQWSLVTVDPALIVAATLLEEEHTLSFWDALIVESARQAGATVLLSEDLQHGRSFGDVRVENPFLAVSSD